MGVLIPDLNAQVQAADDWNRRHLEMVLQVRLRIWLLRACQ